MFTDDALAFAKGKQMRLLDRNRILAAIQVMPEAQKQSLLQRLTGGAYRTPSCPKCKALMVLRSTQSDGMRVYGCPNFPLCRTNTIKVPELKPV
ncbi:MAG: topoisomerase DNA-binding C4 zinc finger domain-containing protein [Algiphilus sp.]